MRKAHSPSTQTYSDIRALTTDLLAQQNPARHFGFAVSRKPATTVQINQRNKIVSVDWAIINKQNQPDVFNVFALFVDHNNGLIRVPTNKGTSRRCVRWIYPAIGNPRNYPPRQRSRIPPRHICLPVQDTQHHPNTICFILPKP
jgi:hypothetical protein